MSNVTIKKVATLPEPREQNKIGRKIEEFLPPASSQPSKVTESKGGGGQVPYRTYWYSDGMAETRVSYRLDREGQQAAHPFAVDIDEGGKSTTLWATDGAGVIDWQQVAEGERREGQFQAGSWFENVMDENKDAKADVVVQGYLGIGANRFEKK